jgi:hypothetical protein
MAGFDTLWDNDWDDDRIVAASLAERRTILTRDKGMLRRAEVERGYFVRAIASEAQLAEVLHALQLEARVQPFIRCRECNVLLEEASAAEVAERVPGRIREMYGTFRHCPACARVYWQGSHYDRMRTMLQRALARQSHD